METATPVYMPIPISDFVQGITIPVDLYLRLNDEKFVLIAKAGTISDVRQFKNYQNREVIYIWVLKREYYKLSHQSISLAGIALSKADLNDKQKTTLIAHSARTVFRQIEGVGLDLDTYNNAKQVTEAVVGLVETHKSFSDLFSSLKSFSDQLLAHSIAVAAIGTMIGHSLGYQKKATLEKLSLGGLLHDIGKKSLPRELLEKPLAAMTNEEIQAYETHPYRGMTMLQSLGIVPDDVVSIVYEHHENSIGQGYPQRIRDVKMHPLAKIIALADAYVNLILPNVNCPAPKNPREALMYIEHTMGTPFNKDAFRALKRLIESEKIAA